VGQQRSPTPPFSGRQIAGSCLYTQTTQAGDAFRLFPSAHRPLLAPGRCCGCQPVQPGRSLPDSCAAAHGLSISQRRRARGAESRSQQGFARPLCSPGGGNIPKCLLAAVFPAVILAAAMNNIGCRLSCPEHRLSQTQLCPSPPPVPYAGVCPPALWGDACVIPREPIRLSNTSAGSPDLHFSPSEGPWLGEGRAETLNGFVLVCFMILLGAVFTQIRQASGLDNLLEIRGV